MITLIDAINSLSPDAKVEIVGQQVYENIKWLDNLPSHPTKDETETKQVEMQTEYDAQAYARNRANSYPSITNVVVALAEKAEGRSAMWDEITAQRLDVKSKYPKP